jgi:short-subunit dehydrogenase
MGLRTLIKKSFYNIRFIKKKNSQIKNSVILITGASSGIGFGLCKRLVRDNKVIAVFNKNETNLKEIKNSNLTYLKCDLSYINNYQEIEKKIIENDIELVFNCAGQFGSANQSIDDMDFDNFLNILKINSLSVLKILQLISNHNKMKYIKKIINISSDAGSVEMNNQGNAYIYRTSKSALNSISKNLSIDLKKNFGISVITIDPGNVKTNMNNKGYLNPEKCSEYIVDIINNSKDYNGAFINLLKKNIPW